MRAGGGSELNKQFRDLEVEAEGRGSWRWQGAVTTCLSQALPHSLAF